MKALIMILTVASLTMACQRPERGEPGLKGDKGDTGAGCSVVASNDGLGALVQCGDSSIFIANGTDGATGATGAVGQNGQDAVPVTIFNLCPGVSGSFPEQAFRVGSKVYAVYSANNKASLAELVPGGYATTAPGANCSFTVNADGSVTH